MAGTALPSKACEEAFGMWRWLREAWQDDVLAFRALEQQLPTATPEELGSVANAVMRSRHPELGTAGRVFSSGKYGNPEVNLAEHWMKHKAQFVGRFDCAFEYAEYAYTDGRTVGTNSTWEVGWRMALDESGWDKLMFNAQRNELIIKSVSGPEAGRIRTLHIREMSNPLQNFRGVVTNWTRPPGVAD